MDEKEIAATVKRIESLAVQIADCQRAFVFYPTSQSLARQETALAKRYNRLLQELDSAGVVHSYKRQTVIEEQPEEMPAFLDLFLRGYIDQQDLAPEPKKKGSAFCDGLSSMVGY